MNKSVFRKHLTKLEFIFHIDGLSFSETTQMYVESSQALKEILCYVSHIEIGRRDSNTYFSIGLKFPLYHLVIAQLSLYPDRVVIDLSRNYKTIGNSWTWMFE